MTRRGRTTVAFVDAFEGEVARLLVGVRVVHLPRSLLPEGAAEGDWVKLVATLEEPPADDDTEARRKRLAEGDDGGDLKL